MHRRGRSRADEPHRPPFSVPGFTLPEEEIPRSGVRLQRIARRRSTDGGTRLWVARHKHGAGNASSGLRYDLAREVEP
jgi:hypothetical protein